MSAAPATQIIGSKFRPLGKGVLMSRKFSAKPRRKENVLVRTFVHLSTYLQDVLNNDVLDKAGAAKQWVIAPNSTVLQLDMDYPEQFNRMQRVIGFVDRTLGVQDVVTTRSKSGCLHVSLLVRRDLNDFTRVIWQIMLGSDPVREALNMVRVLAGVQNPIVLFENPEEGEKLVACQCGRRLLPDGTGVKP